MAAANRSPQRRCALAALLLATLPACSSDRHARDPDPEQRPPIYESRTGIPLLMDLPLIGWLFQHRVTRR